MWDNAVEQNNQNTMSDTVIKYNKKYVLWNVHLPNALHSVCLNRLSVMYSG